jgi:hypothetical protein
LVVAKNLAGWIGLAALLAACQPAFPAHRASEETDDGGAGDVPFGFVPTGPGAVEGTRCTSSRECRSGACVDGVCCQSACTGACLACDLLGAEGRCLPVAEGEDPGNDCVEEPVASCGRDGVCDGMGACRRYKTGTVCTPGGCRDAIERAASTCDGAGTCVPGAAKGCAPALCIGDTCGMPCARHTDCLPTSYCDGGTCRLKRDQAATCTMDEQCGTGHCADGVCCATACAEKCFTCNAAGTAGTCTPVADGLDLKNQCPVQGVYTCGNAGGCNGRGGCRLHLAGSPCGTGGTSCTGFTVLGPSTCDGMGGCKPGPPRDCTPYVCNGNTVCWTACATNDQCRAGRTCRINRCE